MDNIITQLAIILTTSSLLGLIAFKLKLPLIVSYMLTGIVISIVSVFDVSNSLVLHNLPELGIAFVLFLIGMELDLRELKVLGLPIIVSALGQILITTGVGFYISTLLGFNTVESLFLGLGLGFSSTVVVVKMLIEKQDLTSLYGKLSIGILLVEDLIAVIALMVISISSSALNVGLQNSFPVIALVLKAIGLFVLTFILSKYVLQKLFSFAAKSLELLFFTAITWCFAFTALAMMVGFSVEIGAFLAGVALASSPYRLQIQSKIKPLRDFFLTLFFIYLGSQVKVNYLLNVLPIIIIFTLVALIFKPIVYMFILRFFGFRKHTIFQTALNLSQISEFSLIVLMLGVSVGIVGQTSLSIMATVSVLSIVFSSISIQLSKRMYRLFVPLINIMKSRGKVHFLESNAGTDLNEHIIIVGAHRVGGPVVKYLMKAKIPFLVMDFDPYVVRDLREKDINAFYGDIGDPDVLESLHIEKAKLIISTAASMDDNELLLEECKKRKSQAVTIIRAEDKSHGTALKALGADYILLPEKVTGLHLANQIKHHWPRTQFAGLD